MKIEQVKIGDVVPLDYPRRPFGTACDPSWFVLTTDRQQKGMEFAKRWLLANGADDAWFPEELIRKARKRGKGSVRQVTYRPLVPGVVFMLTSRLPQWDILLDRRRIRPLQIADRPVVISEHAIAEMVHVPERITEMQNVARQREIAARLERMPKVGQAAQITDGPLAGLVVSVEAIGQEGAVVVHKMGRVHVAAHNLERVG